MSSTGTNSGGTRPELAEELRARAGADQEARRQGDGPAIQRVDADNTAWFKRLVDTCGWPGRTLVGEEGADAAWLLAQHADGDPTFQEAALGLLAEAAKRGEAPGRHVAYLTDRCQVARGEPQTYGTQYGPGPGGELALQPVVEAGSLDQRRASVGLGPHVEYDALMRRRYGTT
ncbi:DUF6624 domain-containing protein [Streptomyces sp. NPDC094032]|uniref:DUF6624 domain-containing protein n=1 Tax=Streptomyces sp. NPDC094032 TaxID=3155308 RepID=UPI00331DEBED